LPEDAPLCEVGACRKDCVCREGLVRHLAEALLPDADLSCLPHARRAEEDEGGKGEL